MVHGERFNGLSHLGATLLAATGVSLLLALGARAMDAWQVTGIKSGTVLLTGGLALAHQHGDSLAHDALSTRCLESTANAPSSGCSRNRSN